jgi:3-oxoacyl-[acyl-carrier protein] reductase
MDLGIAGRTALVCAASTGLGKACAFALAREGVDVVIAARTAARLEATAEEMRAATDVRVTPVACDLTTEEGRLAALRAADAPDILITNGGGPPLGDFRSFGRAEWLAAVNANMLAPIELIGAVIDPMIERGFGRVVNITSVAAIAPDELFALSGGPRAGLTSAACAIAKRVARHGVTVNNLLPGFIQTDRMEAGLKVHADDLGKPVQDVRAERAAAIPARRFGAPDEFGAVCAFLCSAKAGYVTGQNVRVDGGMYPGAF